jgi:hypothetical protein
MTFAGCRQSTDQKKINAEIRTESEVFTKPRVGKVRIDTTYRGEDRILMVMSYSNVTTRTFCLHGKPMYVESDEDGDGFFETFVISGETMEDFEQFKRKPDGTIEPISKEEYLDLKKKTQEATERMKQAFREVEKEPKRF